MRLGEILEFGNGKPVHSIEKGKYPIYGGNGILGYCNDYLYENILIIGRVGANCGSVAKCNGPCWVSDNAIAAKVKDCANSDYIFYLLSQMDLNKKHIGAAQPLITQGIIRELSVTIPDLPTQDAIASVLSSLDSKISLNRKANEVLESMAKLLYDYWFVQFDFPNAEGKPYKSSGGKMVYNETLKREIPEGWEVLRADEFCKIRTGKEDANFASQDGVYPFFTCSRETLFCNVAAFDSKAILLAGNGDFNVKHYTGKFNAYQRTYVIEPYEAKYWGILYQSTANFINVLKSRSNGAIIKFITIADVNGLVIFKQPNESVYKQLNLFFDTIEHNTQETLRLTSLRDYLLPLLMNGQVKVS